MDPNENITYRDKLRLRAIEVERTIGHLKTERREVETNTEWIDRAAYKSRVRLLDGLITLYGDEMEQIEKAHAELRRAGHRRRRSRYSAAKPPQSVGRRFA